MEDLVIKMLENAPSVAALVYLVVRLDKRLEELQRCMIELLKQQK